MPQDPRINPQSYGPEQAGLTGQGGQGDAAMSVPGPPLTRMPMTDITSVYKDALDSLDPEEAYFLNSVASGHKKRTSTNVLLDAAMSGESLDSIRGQVQAAEASEKALRLAEESMSLSDDEFNQVLSQLQGEMGAMPNLPQRGQIEQPDRLSQGLAALLSLGSPQHAFSIGAVPYQEMARRREEAYQMDVQRYGQQMAQRKERIEMTELRLKIADQRRREAVEALQTQAQQAAQRGEQRRAQAFQLRARVFQADSEAAMDDALSMLRENYPPENMPDPKAVAARREQFRAAEKLVSEKAKFDREKEETDRVNTLVDDFQKTFSTASFYKKEDVDKANAAWKKYAADNKLPLSRLPSMVPYTPVAQQNADLSQQRFNREEERYQDEAPDRAQKARNAVLEGEIKEVDLQRKREALDKELAGGNSDSAKAKKKQIGALTTMIENAKLKLDQHLNQQMPQDEEGKAKYLATIRELFIDEYTIVAKKRELASGKAPSAQAYFAERFPNLKGLFGNIGGQVHDAGTTKKQATAKDLRNLGKSGKLGGGGNAPVLPKGIS